MLPLRTRVLHNDTDKIGWTDSVSTRRGFPLALALALVLCRPPQFPLTSPNRRSSPATVSPSAPIEAYLSLAAMATLYLPQG